jgi:hypothetical protein
MTSRHDTCILAVKFDFGFRHACGNHHEALEGSSFGGLLFVVDRELVFGQIVLSSTETKSQAFCRIFC